MNIVYLITFDNRKQRNELPYYYIGSKSNCKIVDGEIRNIKNNRVYRGSSSCKLYNQLMRDKEPYSVKLLKMCDDYKDLIESERSIQLVNKVVESSMYFNKAYAVVSNYSDSMYATYKHCVTEKVVRLKRDDELVLNRTFVGVTYGIPITNSKSRGRSGIENGFYGKKHTAEVRQHLSELRKGVKLSDEVRHKMSESKKGVKKTESHKRKIGEKSKGYIMLKNITNNTSIKIKKEDIDQYDLTVWKNPASNHFLVKTDFVCEYCKSVTASKGNYTRWHGQNCKYRSNNE